MTLPSREFVQELADGIDEFLQGQLANENIHFVITIIDTEGSTKTMSASSLPRSMVLAIWKGEIDGTAKVTPLNEPKTN